MAKQEIVDPRRKKINLILQANGLRVSDYRSDAIDQILAVVDGDVK